MTKIIKTGIIIGGMTMTLRRVNGRWDIFADDELIEGGFFHRHAAMAVLKDFQQNEVERAERKAWGRAS
jgi:hypothetical protein